MLRNNKNQVAKHVYSYAHNFSRSILAGLALLVAGWLVWQNVAFAQGDNPQIGPGVPNVGSNAPRSAASSSKAGSILFFHKYSSDTRQAGNVNTLITLTNTHPRDGVALRLAWVHGCAIDTSFLTLAGNQTRTLLASAENPNQTGYLMAMAVGSSGLPIQFNWLVGSASYRDARGFEATYNAVGVAKRSNGGARTNADGTVAELLFNNSEYDRLPKTIAVDNLQNQNPNATGGDAAQKTDVMLYSPLANLATTASQNLKFNAVLLDQSGRPYPQVIDSACGLNSAIANLWTETPFNTVITPERQGYATFSANVENAPVPVLGLSLTEGANGALHNARQMQVLSWVDSFKMTVPIAPPAGAPNDPITVNQPEAPGGSLGASEMKAGSVLLFPRFTSGLYGSSRICLTNTHPTQRARLRVFFTGLVEPVLMNENIIILNPNQTVTLNAADFAANQKGWVLALAIDGRAQPTQFNFIIGSAQVSEQTTGLVAGYNALAFAKNSTGAVARNSDAVTTDLVFDGNTYDRMPATLGLNGVNNQQDNTTMLGFFRPPVSLLETPNTRGSLGVTLYDDLLAFFGATLGQLEVRLGTVRTNAQTPPLTNTILRGHRGWLKLNSSTPIFGWFNNLANTRLTVSDGGAWTGGVYGGANLHILTLSDLYLLRTPGNNPNNRPPVAEHEPIDAVIEARHPTGANVRLDGRVSSDPDGPDDPLSFKWFDGDRQISIAKVSDYRFGLGTHILRLTVLDGNNTPSEPSLYFFQINDTQPPLISGIPSNISKTTGSAAGVAINYPLPIAYDMVDGNVSVTASKLPGSVFPIGRTTVIFKATDSSGNESTARMEVNVTKGTATLPTLGGVPGDKLPALANLNDQYVIIGKPKTITLQANDPDNDAVTFRLTGAPSYVRIDAPDPVNRTAKLIIEPRQGDQVAATNVRIIATDSRGGSFTTLPFRVQISDIETDERGTGIGPTGPDDPGTGVGPGGPGGPGNNRPPVARMVPLAPTAQATTKLGAIVKLDGSPSSDPDLDALTYEWFDSGVKIAEGAIVDANLPVGLHSITLTVSDPKNAKSSTEPAQIEVLPRPLTLTGVTPAKIPQFNQITMTVYGTGFVNDADASKATKVRFDCSPFCSGGSQVQVNVVSIEEDTIVLSVKTTLNTPFGNRDCVVTNPDGTTARLARSNYVSR